MPDAIARLLQRLIDNGAAPRSHLSARTLKSLESLFDCGALAVSRRGGGFVVEVCDASTVAAFYNKRYPSGDAPLDGPPRARAVASLRNAKRAGRSDREPVLLRALTPCVCERDGQRFDLKAQTELAGAACLLIEEGRFWRLAAEVAIVENLECFLRFEDMGVAAEVALYASGRLSKLALQWLASPEMTHCRYTHCGDYDPVGLDEYMRVKEALGARARLHLPRNLKALMARYGRADLLRDSTATLQRMRGSSDPDARRVLDAMNETGCGLEQEILLMR